MNVEIRAIFSGRVQGVGFRATVRTAAQRLSITGTAENLEDGTVELIVQGDKEQIEQLFQEIREVLFPGFISHVEMEQRPISLTYNQFEIR